MAVTVGAVAVPSALGRDAYVVNTNSDDVTVIDTAANTAVGGPIAVESGPNAIAFTPDGSRAYVAAGGIPGQVSAIDTASRSVVGPPIPVGDRASSIAISPSGSHAYVGGFTLAANVFSVIDLATDQPLGAPTPLAGFGFPPEFAITPDGSRVYLTDETRLLVLDTASNDALGPPLPLGVELTSIAITPDGQRLYVGDTYVEDPKISVIDTATNTVVETISDIPPPLDIAITPNGSRAYVSNGFSSGPNAVSVIDTATNDVLVPSITLASGARAIAITPDGSRAYATHDGSDSVSVIDTATNAALGLPIPVGDGPSDVAITPNQPPVASFVTAPHVARAGAPVAFDASASTDPDGRPARYDWDFGDGTALPDGGPSPAHVFAKPGTYEARLTLTDNEGCSTELVFTGQTASCNGSAVATRIRAIRVRKARLCGGRPATLLATADERLRGTEGDDVIRGSRGDDRISAAGGNDLVCARGGDDRVGGGKGDDRLRGGQGDDRLAGGPGSDRLNGGGGTDTCSGGREDRRRSCER